MTLSEKHISQYKKDGFIHLRGVVPGDVIDLARTILQCWVDETIQQWVDEGLLTDPLHDLDFQVRLLQAWEKAGRPKYSRSPRRDLVSRETFDFLRHPSLVDLAEALLGTPEISLHGVFNARAKLPDQVWTDTPWHQDAQYYQDAEHTHVVSIWIPLQRVTEENSCLQVARSLQNNTLHERWNDPVSGFIGISPDIQKTLDDLSIEMNPGDALCFTQLTPHRALPNKSNAVRWAMDLRFEATEHATEKGKERGFIVRSLSYPSSITAYEEWMKKWEGQPAGTY
jgi:phytanoyl-CoA hydroxylase